MSEIEVLYPVLAAGYFIANLMSYSLRIRISELEKKLGRKKTRYDWIYWLPLPFDVIYDIIRYYFDNE